MVTLGADRFLETQRNASEVNLLKKEHVSKVSETKTRKEQTLKEGTKYDVGKLRFDLIPVYSLEQLAAIYTFGATKYEDHNWRKGLRWSRVFGALMRHLWAFWRGEEIDSESGLPHLAHAAWGTFTLLEYSRIKRDFDDRVEEEVSHQK